MASKNVRRLALNKCSGNWQRASASRRLLPEPRSGGPSVAVATAFSVMSLLQKDKPTKLWLLPRRFTALPKHAMLW